jgi:hypothetical protein
MSKMVSSDLISAQESFQPGQKVLDPTGSGFFGISSMGCLVFRGLEKRLKIKKILNLK